MTGQDVFEWHWDGHTIPLAVTRRGAASDGRSPVLMLPAPSSISTRGEMRALQDWLAPRHASLAIDVPGFGVGSKPAVAWSPAAFRAFLHDLAAWAKPSATVAAGHMGIFALDQAGRSPGSLGQLVMVAPTWRGPLPTMMKRRPRWLRGVAASADLPVIGQSLYRLNVNRPMVMLMAREHVYCDPAWLSGARFVEKRAVADSVGARHASVRFVAGLLDPAERREDVLAMAARLNEATLLIRGDATPKKSLAEMEALAEVPHIRRVVVPGGKLAVHEEKAAEVGEAVVAFLSEAPRA